MCERGKVAFREWYSTDLETLRFVKRSTNSGLRKWGWGGFEDILNTLPSKHMVSHKIVLGGSTLCPVHTECGSANLLESKVVHFRANSQFVHLSQFVKSFDWTIRFQIFSGVPDVNAAFRVFRETSDARETSKTSATAVNHCRGVIIQKTLQHRGSARRFVPMWLKWRNCTGISPHKT